MILGRGRGLVGVKSLSSGVEGVVHTCKHKHNNTVMTSNIGTDPNVVGSKKLKIALYMPINPEGKFILSLKEQRSRFKVSSEELSTEIDILVRSSIQVPTEADVA